MFPRFPCFFGLALALASAPAEAFSDLAPRAENAGVRIGGKSLAPGPLTAPDRIEVSIPYPNAGMYLHRGIYGSFAGGRNYVQYEDTALTARPWQDALFQWQGEIGYYYTEWFSAGVGFRIVAGSPNDDQQTVKNRYYLLTRFHKAWPRSAMYLGARLGTDDVSFTLLNDDTTGVGGKLRESNISLGLTYGYGWKFSRYAGFTFGESVDESLVPQNPGSPHRTINFLSQPGLALDVVRVFPSLGEYVKAFYLLSEFQAGQSLSERGRWVQQYSWILGTSMGF